MSLESEFGTELGTRVWSLGQSLGPASGVWVRVSRQSLESGQSLGQSLGPEVWSLGQRLGPESGLEFGSEFGARSAFGSEFGATVWGQSLEFGVRVRVRVSAPKAKPGNGFGSESGAGFWLWVWTRIWDRVRGRVEVWGQSLGYGSEFGSRQSW